jgi:hypothetical protein
MVHALCEVWRTLIPGAVLLDIRPYLPFGPLELVHPEGTSVLGRLDEVESDPNDAAADEAIAEVLRRGLFHLDRADSFHYAGYGIWRTMRAPARLTDVARRRGVWPGWRASRCAPPDKARLRLMTYVVVNRLRRSFPEA